MQVTAAASAQATRRRSAPGARGTLEKDVTLDIARHVVARLGGIAALTRTGDHNLTLGARAQHAERGGADVFVSIHANSGPPEASGPETFVHRGAAIPGHSGSPVFWNDTAIAILTGPRMLGAAISDYENRGVMLSPEKIDWINSK
jgi:N-acetylmuramoyl-L-alanine amidase